MSTLERFLIAEIKKAQDEIRQLEEEIRLYEKMLHKHRKDVSRTFGTKLTSSQ